MKIKFSLNGRQTVLDVPGKRRLIDVLRNDLGLTGTKEGCSIGECGACTVVLNGRAVHACMTAAAQLNGGELLTIEGLKQSGELDQIQQAFIHRSAVQCGFCTAGMIMSVKALLLQNPHPTREETERALAGNLCRCTGYQEVRAAVREASESGTATEERPVGEQTKAVCAKPEMTDPAFMQPETMTELLDALSGMTEHSVILAGGTDLYVRLREKGETPDRWLSLCAAEELFKIEEEDGFVKIGAMVTHSEAEHHPLIRRYFQALCTACGKVGSQQIRNKGTLAGNVANHSPAGDILPCLYLLDAELLLLSRADGERRIPAQAFRGCQAGELIAAIYLPVRPAQKSAFVKLGSRREVTIAQISMCAAWETGEKGRRKLRACIGAIDRYPVLFEAADKLQTGTYEDGAEAAEVLRTQIRLLREKRKSAPKLKLTEAERLYKERAAKGVIFDLLAEMERTEKAAQ